MPAESVKQQRLMGMVHAVQKGDMSSPSKKVSDVAKSMKPSDAKDYASTKHKGLPMKKGAKTADSIVKAANLVTNYFLIKNSGYLKAGQFEPGGPGPTPQTPTSGLSSKRGPTLANIVAMLRRPAGNPMNASKLNGRENL